MTVLQKTKSGDIMILGDSYLRNARYFPDDIALVDPYGQLTHSQFLDRVIRLINALVSKEGARAQDRLAVLSFNSKEMVEITGAAELGGFIVLPLNHRLAVPELVEIVKDASPRILFYQGQLAPQAKAVAAATGTALICIDEPTQQDSEYEQLIASSSSARLLQQAREEDGVHLVYTSGTTGRAKGVLLSQQGQVQMVRTMSASSAVHASSRLLLVMPLFHVGGKSQQLTHQWQGAGIYLQPKFDVRELIAAINRHQITVAHLAPVMLRAVLDTGATGKDMPSLKTIVYASSPIPKRDLVEAIERFGPIFIQYYGMTETGPLCTLLDKQFHVITGDESLDARLGSAGYPQLGVDIEIRKPDGSPCNSGEPGEVYVRTPTLMIGHWNPVERRAVPEPRGWFATGDMGYLGKDGFLYLIDRKKDMIVSGGENIYSREVEAALLEHPSVRETAVIGVPHEKWGECVAAYVVCDQRSPITEEQLVAHCKSLIASYKKPHHIFFVQSLPRLGATAKIDKKALRAKHWENRERFIS
jgi:acyl-CoA synthetase (AMP-forming)/AMP-acid ligase II